jgi:hypothetical protein
MYLFGCYICYGLHDERFEVVTKEHNLRLSHKLTQM